LICIALIVIGITGLKLVEDKKRPGVITPDLTLIEKP
jgi:hypothetical protein